MSSAPTARERATRLYFLTSGPFLLEYPSVSRPTNSRSHKPGKPALPRHVSQMQKESEKLQELEYE
jgi:hypothetical protein